MNGQFRDTNNIGHKTQNKDNEKKTNKQNTTQKTKYRNY